MDERQQDWISDPHSADDRRELKLVLEVADIIDELKMLRHVITTQQDVLRAFISGLTRFSRTTDVHQADQGSTISIKEVTILEHGSLSVLTNTQLGNENGLETTKVLAQAISSDVRKFVVDADDTMRSVITEIDTINKDAEYTHKMVRHVAVAKGENIN